MTIGFPVTVYPNKAYGTVGIAKLHGSDITGKEVQTPALSVSPMDFGAAGNGSTNDTAAVIAAITYGSTNNVQVRGGQNTYAVSGDLLFDTISNINIDGLKVKQLTPNSATRKTLYFSNCPSLRLRNIVVDRNGLGAQGGLNTAGGIWIYGGSGHRCYNLESYGNGMGNGVVVISTTDSVYYDLNGHDIAYDSPSATDDLVQGVWIYANTNCAFYNPRAKDLTGNPSAKDTHLYTRGIAIAGNVRCDIIVPKVENVDQGLDISGSDGNIECNIIGGSVKNCCTWGVKLANSAVRCKVIGVVAENPGLAGFVVSGPDGLGYTNQSMDNDFIGCTSINAGTAYTGVSGTKSGFRLITQPPTAPQDYPKGIRFVDCVALDNQGSPTMQYGFFSNTDYATNDGTSKKINELVNCKSIGHTTATSSGFAAWNVSLTGTGSQTLTTATPASINWDAEDYDTGAMHSLVSNIDVVTIQVDGLYRIEADVNFNANATGLREIKIQVNSTDVVGSRVTANAVAGGDDTCLYTSVVKPLVAGQNVKVVAQQKSGGNLTVQRQFSSFKITLLQQS